MTTPLDLNTLKVLLTGILPQWPEGPRDWQVQETYNILMTKDQLIVAGCGQGKTAAMYLHLLVHQATARNSGSIGVPNSEASCGRIVLNVSPLTDLARSQVSCHHWFGNEKKSVPTS